jgi:hypothetical protein
MRALLQGLFLVVLSLLLFGATFVLVAFLECKISG